MKSLLSLSLLFAAGMATAQAISLDELLAAAKANNPMLKEARAELAKTVARHSGTRAMAGPMAGLSGFATTGNKPSILESPLPVQPQNFMGIEPGTFLSGSLMVMAPLFARELNLRVGAARWQVRAAAAEVHEAESEVILMVTERYWATQSLAEEIAALESRRTAIQELLRTTQARFEVGSTIEASVSRVQAELSMVERRLVTTRNESAKAALDLRALLGRPMDTPLELSPHPAPSAPIMDVSEWVRIAQAQRGKLLAAKARVGASESELRAARALNQPKLYAVGMADATNLRHMSGVTVGLSLSFPLYDGGRIRAEISEAKSMQLTAEAQFEMAKLEVEKEVHQAFLDRQTALANTQSAESSLLSAEASYEVIRLRVEAGKAILLEQLDALQVLAEARAELTRSQFELKVAEAMLRRAAGVSL